MPWRTEWQPTTVFLPEISTLKDLKQKSTLVIRMGKPKLKRKWSHACSITWCWLEHILFGGMYFKTGPHRTSTYILPKGGISTHTHTIRHEETGCHDLRSAKITNCRLRHTKSAYIDGEKLERVTDFIFFGSKITAYGDCSHDIKRCLLRGRKAMTNLEY